MIRFKVIRASRLLMGLVIAVLVIVLAVLIARITGFVGGAPASNIGSQQRIVHSQDQDDEAVAAFAAASSLDRGAGLFVEDEHTDATALQSDLPMLIEKIPFEPKPVHGEALLLEQEEPDEQGAPAAPKRVLVYHTHTHEAYQQDENDPYVPTEQWRTQDPEHSIVRVGRELTELLREMGVEVVHDITDHEPPKLGTAYVRSLETLKKYDGQPFDCYIDVHRDAYVEGQSSARVLTAGGTSCAQLMMLIGNGEGFEDKPFYQENVAFARQITLALNQGSKGLCKDVLVKNGRYNQHIGKRAILVEVGNNMNTLQEALNAMPMLAQAIYEVLDGDVFLPEPKVVPVNAAG